MAIIAPSLEELAERTAAQEAAEAAREAERANEGNKKNDEIDSWSDLEEDEEWINDWNNIVESKYYDNLKEIVFGVCSKSPAVESSFDNIRRIASILIENIYEKHPGLKEAREIAPENAKPLTGYLWDALESMRQTQPEYKTISLSDIIQAAWSTDGAETGEYKELIDQAKKARDKYREKEAGENDEIEEIEDIFELGEGGKNDHFKLLTFKPVNDLFETSLCNPGNIYGETDLAGRNERSKKSKINNPPFVICWSALLSTLPDNVEKQLTSLDRSVFDAVCTAFLNKQPGITLQQIHYYVAGKSNGSPDQLERYKASLWKMKGIPIDVKKKGSTTTNKTRFSKCLDEIPEIYDTVGLIEFDMKSAIVRGKLLKDGAVIFPTNKPPVPFIEMADSLNQIATLKIDLLNVPKLRLTEKNLSVRNYLIHRISMCKDDKLTIKKKTLLQKCNMDNKYDRHRIDEKINTILNHYKELGEIADYSLEFEGEKVNPQYPYPADTIIINTVPQC